MCPCETTVILQRTKQRVSVDAVAIPVESAGVPTVKIVALGDQETFVAEAISVSIGIGYDGILDRH